MRLLYVADGRSPIARAWIGGFVEEGHEVHLVTTYRSEALPGLASMQFLPVALSGRKSRGGSPRGAGGIGVRTRVRQWLGPLTVPWRADRLNGIIEELHPDLVHALRIPFEGMLASWATSEVPLAVSSWGNDFTLHAPSSPLMGWLTQRTLQRADGLHADCERDLRLAGRWGFVHARPAVVLPGNGGVPAPFFNENPSPPPGSPVEELLGGLRPDQPLIVQPRGFRAYVRNDTFFQSLPFVYRVYPEAVVACPDMAGEPLAERWLEGTGEEGELVLLPKLDTDEMAALLARAWMVVSPSEHDGTPNSLLEAMACGAVPVVGDLESLREWVEDGQTGRLVDPGDSVELGLAIVEVLQDPEWRRTAAERNRKMVEERARRPGVMERAQQFYAQVVGTEI